MMIIDYRSDNTNNHHAGHTRGEIRCPAGTDHSPLSLASCLTTYLARSDPKRVYYEGAENAPSSHMFISTTKPYGPASSTTLAHWLVTLMARAGIETSSYRAHSARSAASSALVRKGLSIAQVLKRAHWSPTSRTFEMFYHRPTATSSTL